jgi:hypothetical protein
MIRCVSVHIVTSSSAAVGWMPAGVNQQPPMHQLMMSPFNPFCGWTSSLPVEIFFSPPLCPEILYLPPPTYPLLPTTYQAHPPLLPPPSYLPPTNPTPPHSIARAPETSSGCGAGAGAVAMERELERLELWLWSGSWSRWSWSWTGWSWSRTHAPTKR